MIEKVRTYIDREIGLDSNALILIALSGGADSTALLLVMKELGYTLQALHCNFHLRGDESDRDQHFVEELCKEQNVPLSVRHFQTEEVAKERGISIEMAARDLRYDWFREEMKARKAFCIAVAHHRDDQAETMLLNLLRGTGLRGLAGMQAKHEGIIRPLLCLSRAEILQYLESRGQSFVTDSTNSERTYLRNHLRLDVIPLLQSINPAAIEHLCLASDNVRESIPYYIKGIEATFKEQGITTNTFPFKALESRTLLHEWLSDKGFNRAQEEEMMSASNSQVGKVWLSNSHSVLRDRDALIVSSLSKQTEKPQIRQEIVSQIEETGPNVAYFDADLLTNPIEVRLVREGDSFVPFGMKGRKLVSDYLTDRKLNRFEKAEQFVAVCGDEIIWLIGHRSDNRYKVTDATKRILKLSVVKS
ncbi:MAG: tRNA lysidine(34) synthetase TilS [Bacteroidaceae bacterium]|nr:tRNA lysidine(34) synthetase TilS [Bacteroidaceae bacterium]